ncbi:MAG TPA: ABC transporter substrate-binding protein [Chloroflexota bacterium]|nr:ABC transporter substrate-binding protein [Chloroflexota bacterium]
MFRRGTVPGRSRAIRRLGPALLAIAMAGCGGQAAPAPASSPASPAAASASAPAAASPASAKPAASAAAAPSASAPAGSAAAPASGAARPKFKLATVGLAPEAPVYLASDKGYFADAGVDVEYAPFRGSSEVVPLLATGGLDFAPAGIDASLFNAAQRDTGVKMLASEAVANKEGPGGAALVVAQSLIDSGEYKSVKDLKGKTIAVNSRGGVGEMIVEEVLATAGLKVGDVNLQLISFPDMAGALANRKIDAAYLTEPFISIGVSKGISKVVTLAGDVHPNLIGLVLLGGSNLKSEPDAAARFMVAYLRGLRFYYSAYFTNANPASKQDVIDSITKHTPNKDPKAVAAMGMTGVDPNGAIDQQELQKFQDYFLKAGTQKTAVPLDQVVDTSYLQAALKQLGPFKA